MTGGRKVGTETPRVKKAREGVMERRRGEREKEGKRGRVTKKWIGGRGREEGRRKERKEKEERKRVRRRGEREKEGKRGRVTKKWIGGRLTNRKRYEKKR